MWGDICPAEDWVNSNIPEVSYTLQLLQISGIKVLD